MSFTDMDIEGGNSEFLKLTSGTVVNIHILSPSPTKSVIHWENKKKVNCLGGSACELCLNGDRPKQRWTCDVWDRKDKTVKKFEFGSMIASQLKAIAEMMAESQKTIHDTDIRIKTTGSNLETEYSVLHVPATDEIPSEVTEKYSIPF